MADLHLQSLIDWFHKNFIIDSFIGADGGRIRFALQRRVGARGVAVVVTGRSEWIEKYLEVAADLQESGWAVCLYDHCGQGGSDRPLADPHKGHIDDFSLYAADLISLIDRIGSFASSRPIVLLAHSMGGAIATLALSDRPHLADGLILVSPMLQINTGCLPPLLGEALSSIVCRLGGEACYVWGGGPCRMDLPFVGNDLTSDATRFARNQLMITENSRLSLGSPTFGWLRQAYRGMRLARRSAGRLTCPVLLLVGTADTVVSVPAMLSFARGLSQGTVTRYAGARHEVLMERDEVRNKAIADILSFIDTIEQSTDAADLVDADGRESTSRESS